MSTTCRACGTPLSIPFIDLGDQPLANGYLHSPHEPEKTYPLRAYICAHCLLVQADTTVSPSELFSEYAFFSSGSEPWLKHCRRYAAKMMLLYQPRTVLEIASNDGTLLAHFPDCRILGVDPAVNVSESANTAGIPTINEFFTAELASDLPKSDLVVANNVLGHVPDLPDFVDGLRVVLAPEGVLTIEVPWLWNLIRECQFDTIYHEHFSYFSLFALRGLLERHGLRVFDVELLDVHGGSLRVYACHDEARYGLTPEVGMVLATEFGRRLDIADAADYQKFQSRVDQRIYRLRGFFDKGYGVAGAGAPAKGNTLLNAAGVTQDDMAFTTDTSPHKQGLFLPGSHIPICPPSMIQEVEPEFVFLLAWNWADEIMAAMDLSKWGGRFVVPIPEVKVL